MPWRYSHQRFQSKNRPIAGVGPASQLFFHEFIQHLMIQTQIRIHLLELPILTAMDGGNAVIAGANNGLLLAPLTAKHQTLPCHRTCSATYKTYFHQPRVCGIAQQLGCRFPLPSRSQRTDFLTICSLRIIKTPIH